MKSLFTYFTMLSISICFTFSYFSISYAQQDEFMLEEITVSAQKRDENQQNVPIAMEVVSGEDLIELGKDNVEDILRSFGNIIVSRADDGLRISLRGIADDSSLNQNNQHVSSSTVAINIDGAYNNRSDAGMWLYDIDRVEVLFGPQSTMYASNSPGGIVNIVTASPKTDKYEGSALLEYGNYNYLHTEGMMNTPIGKKAALRASFYTAVHDGYISNGSDSEDSKSGRLKFLVEPIDNFSLTLTGSYSKSGGYSSASIEPFDKQSDRTDPWTSTSDLDTPSNMSQKTFIADMDLYLGIGVLSIVSSYSKNNDFGTMVMQMGPFSITQDYTTSNEQKGIEARMVNASDSPFEWIIGANYFLSEDYRYAASTSSVSEGINDQKKRALFTNITYPFTEAFRVTGGYRLSWDVNDCNDIASEGSVGPGSTYAHLEYSGEGDTKFGFEYDLGANSMLYADRSTSYRLQSPVSTGETQLPPEKLISYTLGSKNRFLNNRLQLNIAAFFYDYKNKMANQTKAAFGVTEEMAGYDFNYDGIIDDTLVDAINQTTGEINSDATGELEDPYAQGCGDFQSFGLDLQLNYLITNNDFLDIFVSYLHSEWANLYFDYYYENFQDEDFSGDEDTFSPDITVSLSYSHDFYLPNNATIKPKIDVRYQSSYLLTWTEADDPYRYQEAHYIFDLSTTYKDTDSRWTLSCYVKNLFDYAEKRSYYTTDSDTIGTMMIGSPRTFGAVLSMTF